MDTPYDRAIQLIGSEAKAAALLGYKTSWGLAKHRGRVPSEKVIDFCRATDWKVTPNEIRPDIYPNPTDGLPTDFVTSEAFLLRLEHRRQQAA